jgi:hypothetical protein
MLRHIDGMSQIVLDVPNESLLALRTTPEAVGGRLLLAAAVKLYSSVIPRRFSISTSLAGWKSFPP